MTKVDEEPYAGAKDAPRTLRSRLDRMIVRSVVAFAILALLVTLTIWGLLAWGGRRLEAQLEAIRARGEPALPEEITWPARETGENPLAWLRALAEVEHEDFSVEDLPSCAASGHSSDDRDWSEIHATLADPVRAESLDACEREFLDRDLDSNRASLELALQVGRYARLDPRPASQANTVDALLEGFRLPDDVFHLLQPTRVLSHAARAAAMDGHVEEAVEYAQLAMRSAELLDDMPSVACLAVSFGMKRIVLIEGILPVVHLLPAGSNLTAIEQVLDGLQPRAHQLSAFLGERAFVNRLYDLLRRDMNALDGLELVSSFRARVVRAALDHDQADYLEEWALAVHASRRPPWDPAWRALEGDVLMEPRPHRYYNLISLMVLPPAHRSGEWTAKLEARCLLTRAAILARREGAQAAGEWIATQTDPFVGRPLRWRIDADGLMVLWSAGANRVDDGGTIGDSEEPPLDEVVRVRPR